MLLFAEGNTEAIGPWASLIGSLTGTGFSIVVCWYLLTKALPKMHDDFVAALGKQEESGKAAIAKLQDSFEARDRERRSDGKDALAAIVAHCEREAARRDEVLKVELGMVAKASNDQREVLEEFRDVLREFLASRQRPRLRPGPSLRPPPPPDPAA